MFRSRADVLQWGEAADRSLRSALAIRDAREALLDPRGRTVRCTPRRRTVRVLSGSGAVLYRKLRCDDVRGDAAREWELLDALRAVGLEVPGRVLQAQRGVDSVIVTVGVGGRPLDAWIRDAAHEAGDGFAAVARYVEAAVIPAVRRLHDAGWCYRDLYFNHLHADRLAPDCPPRWLDVERAFRPSAQGGARVSRWIVKDLAGLIASWPWRERDADFGRLLLDAYGGSVAGAAGRRVDVPWDAVFAKAGRIRAHVPKYG